jgi:hypothetical protein
MAVFAILRSRSRVGMLGKKMAIAASTQGEIFERLKRLRKVSRMA